MAIFPIIALFLSARLMHDVACEFACAVAMGTNVLNISDVGNHQTNNDGETSECGFRVNLLGNKYVLILISSIADWPSLACLEFFCLF